MPINAMAKPPKACPMIEPVSHVAELIVAAEGSCFLGTILEINAENVGPEKALIAPVNAIMINIKVAVVQG